MNANRLQVIALALISLACLNGAFAKRSNRGRVANHWHDEEDDDSSGERQGKLRKNRKSLICSRPNKMTNLSLCPTLF